MHSVALSCLTCHWLVASVKRMDPFFFFFKKSNKKNKVQEKSSFGICSNDCIFSFFLFIKIIPSKRPHSFTTLIAREQSQSSRPSSRTFPASPATIYQKKKNPLRLHPSFPIRSRQQHLAEHERGQATQERCLDGGTKDFGRP